MFRSSGQLRYSMGTHGPRLVLEIDPQITDYARSLFRLHRPINKPRYPAHITLVREETIPHPALWGKREGETVWFNYDSAIRTDETYCWLRVWSEELLRVRTDLGLPPLSWGCRPPTGEDCFHTTIGNFKEQE